MTTFINLHFSILFFFLFFFLFFLTCMFYKENVLETGFEDAVLQKHTLLDNPVKEVGFLRCLCLLFMLGGISTSTLFIVTSAHLSCRQYWTC